MKLYIKANNIKVLKNLDTLLPNANAKAEFLLGKYAYAEYKANLEGAKVLDELKEDLFYESKRLGKLVKGIYFGNSSCEHLLPSIAELVEAQSICMKQHYNFVFVFPPLSAFKMEEAEYLMKHLAQSEENEVVVNDIGTLQLLLQYKSLKPILGLNFTKVIKNAFIDVVKPTELSSIQLENQKELLSHLEFEVPEVREFYKALNIGRFAIENINLDMEFLDTAPRMYCDFYYPHITLANSKACDIAGAFDDQRGHFVHEDCSRYCNYASLEFGNADTLKLQQRYNTVYKTNTQLEVPNVLKKNSKNRFIWELFL